MSLRPPSVIVRNSEVFWVVCCLALCCLCSQAICFVLIILMLLLTLCVLGAVFHVCIYCRLCLYLYIYTAFVLVLYILCFYLFIWAFTLLLAEGLQMKILANSGILAEIPLIHTVHVK